MTGLSMHYFEKAHYTKCSLKYIICKTSHTTSKRTFKRDSKYTLRMVYCISFRYFCSSISRFWILSGFFFFTWNAISLDMDGCVVCKSMEYRSMHANYCMQEDKGITIFYYMHLVTDKRPRLTGLSHVCGFSHSAKEWTTLVRKHWQSLCRIAAIYSWILFFC